MLILPLTVILLLSLFVLLAGLFMLNHAKKENSNKFTKIASYTTISFSSLVFVCGLICSFMFAMHHGCCGDKNECHGRRGHADVHALHHGGKAACAAKSDCGHQNSCCSSSASCEKEASCHKSKKCERAAGCEKSADCEKKCEKKETAKTTEESKEVPKK